VEPILGDSVARQVGFGILLSSDFRRIDTTYKIKYFFCFVSHKSNACNSNVCRGQRRLRLYDSKIANEIFDFDIDFGIAFYQFAGEKAFSDIGTRR